MEEASGGRIASYNNRGMVGKIGEVRSKFETEPSRREGVGRKRSGMGGQVTRGIAIQRV